MDDIRNFFKNRRNVLNTLLLLVIVLAIPLGINLARHNQIFFSRAAGEFIQLIDGSCVAERNGTKVIICKDVPLQIISPFVATNTPEPSSSEDPSTSPSPASSSSSSSPSPAASASNVAHTIRVNGHTGTDIQNALTSLKTTGGAVYIPAGTYIVDKKLTIYSNTTVFGDGMDNTILQQASTFPVQTDPLIANDINTGTTKIVVRDLTLKGAGIDSEKRNSDGSVDRCCAGLQFKNFSNGFVYRVKATDFGQSGILFSYNKGKGVEHTRVSECNVSNNFGGGIEIWAGSNNVIDHCTATNNNRSKFAEKKNASINLELGVDIGIKNNRILSNTSSNNKNVGISLKSDNRTEFPNSNNSVCFNTTENNGDVGIADANGTKNIYIANKINNNQDRRDGKIVICDSLSSSGACQNNGNQAIEDESNNANNPACAIPTDLANIPPVPAKPTAMNPLSSLTAFFQNKLLKLIPQAYAQTEERGFNNASPTTSSSNNIQNLNKSCNKDSACNNDLLICVNKRCALKSSPSQPAPSASLSPCLTNGNSKAPPFSLLTFFNGIKQNISNFVVDRFKVSANDASEGGSGSTDDTNDTGSTNSTPKSCKTDHQCKTQGGKCINRVCIGKDPSPSPSAAPSSAPSSTPCPSGNSTPLPSGASSPLPSSESTPSPSGSSPHPSSPGNVPGILSYRLAESESGLSQATWRPYVDDPTTTNFTLADDTPGVRQIWVEFVSPTGETKKDSLTITVSDKGPIVSSISCNIDSIDKQNVKVIINGDQFGSKSGQLTSDGGDMDILEWKNENITGIIKKPELPTDQTQTFKVKVTRDDTVESEDIPCRIDSSVITLGARVFCRDENHFAVDNVKVTIVDENGAKVEETAKIDDNGIIDGLKTKLQAEHIYAISLQAPHSLRRNALFTASAGTSVITAPDGSPFILPIGDIAPTLADGIINTADRSLLTQQWIASTEPTKAYSADFNQDGLVNSFDWACMRYDFGKTNEPIPTNITP